MKKAIWTISLFFDDEKSKLMFKKDYNKVDDIIKDFKLSKTFLYNCCRKDKYIENSRKDKSTSKKYNRMKIEKKTFNKDGSFVFRHFG